ncbi:lamin tail domain-containing protein [Pedobacter sp. SD-b]|uniref:Lamin tail domain-containing protein n=1 Tax=Pedobacter segetis TaxID=2793069 RepID=A0ABS1BJX2_9SPHI|nr:lamin tail domain-containing protein [Pedobacter segetis]MBK0383193.1 lamin tail domain-containing protein [Pedobacter segetis]
MRKFLLVFILFTSKVAFSQVNENFSDGDFTQNPAWQADAVSNFTVVNGQLRSNSTTLNSNFYISTPNSKALNCTWAFDVNLQFATSGANYVDVYLISNVADLKSTNINGYFLRMGNTNDEVALYKRSGNTGTSVKIIDGRDGSVSSSSNNPFKFKITRESNGNFTLERDSTGTGNSFISEGSVIDNTFTTTSSFGFFIQQSTASFQQKHFFDNIVIQDIIPDVTPPVLNTANTTNGTNITLNFNEPLDANDAAIANHYNITPGNIQPSSVTVNGAVATLNLANQLATGNYTVTVSSVKDIKGNTAAPQSKGFAYHKPYTAQPNDIVINEIFADPSPQVDLPTMEFVELWNRSTEDISLAGFKYSDPTTIATFGNDSIKANSYLIICAKADTLEFKKFGKVIGLSPWPTLNNSGDLITLANQNGTILSQVNYFDTFYKDAVKKNGGWTLELIDPNSTCKPSQNYSASIDPTGGTPGRQNSIYLSNQTTAPLQLLSASVKDNKTILLTFNRGLDSLQATLPSHYMINNGVGQPQTAIPLSPSFSTVELDYAQALNRNQTYTVTVNGVSDCGVNTITNQTLELVYPALIAKGDVLINEVLYNPKSGGVDFVEVYNNSDKILDFKDLKIATKDAVKDSVVSIKIVSGNTLLFRPKTYWVITTNPDTVKAQYQTQNNNFIKLSSLPSYSDVSGSVILLNKDSSKLDQLDYNKNMQFALLKDLNGVSLERSSFSQPTNAVGNFRSAAASVGYATPGYKNSQFLEDVTPVEEISFASKTFSPDNDGYQDVLQILYQFSKPNYAANVTIYNDQGVLIRKLIQNQTLATSGQWIWDGLDQTSQKAKTGIYIIYTEIFDLNGNVKKFKNTAVLAGKFN